MTWTRYYARKLFKNIMPHVPLDRAQKYIGMMRILYFFSAGSMLIWYLNFEKEANKKQLESGRPLIVDTSEAHRTLRNTGADFGIIYNHEPGKGVKRIDFNKEEYLAQLERESLERGRAAQQKLLDEGRELPPEAIKLV